MQIKGRSWILVAAYDVSTGETSEGHVAFNILRHLCKTHRIILVTRRNNKARMEVDPHFAEKCSGVYLVGYDLPNWACWWKRGARFYQAYAYLWQMTWPFALAGHNRLHQTLRLVHVLNFHNDSIPSLAWLLGSPVVWGPINHNEVAAPWRRTFWPKCVAGQHMAAFALRCVLWKIDPFLRFHIRNCRVVLSAGDWVDQRLDLSRVKKVIRRSQLGVREEEFSEKFGGKPFRSDVGTELVCVGRLDWIKGFDLAIEALSLLPIQYHLKIVGEGPAESQLRSLAAQLGVENRVVFQPPVPRNALSGLYAHADLFLFPSAEVAGLIWVEALACGLPVVAFDGKSEVSAAARNIPGIHLVKCGKERRGQVEGLATAIRAAADVTYAPAKLRATVLEHYGWAGLAVKIREAYSTVLEARR